MKRPADSVGAAAAEHVEPAGTAVFGVHADFCERYFARRRAGTGIADERGGSGSGAGSAAVCGANISYKGLAKWIAAMSVMCAMRADRVFTVARVLDFGAVLFVVGFAATSQMAATNTTVQNRVPDELRGRVMAVYATMFMGVQPIGALLAGGVAKRIGAPSDAGDFWDTCVWREVWCLRLGW